MQQLKSSSEIAEAVLRNYYKNHSTYDDVSESSFTDYTEDKSDQTFYKDITPKRQNRFVPSAEL